MSEQRQRYGVLDPVADTIAAKDQVLQYNHSAFSHWIEAQNLICREQQVRTRLLVESPGKHCLHLPVSVVGGVACSSISLKRFHCCIVLCSMSLFLSECLLTCVIWIRFQPGNSKPSHLYSSKVIIVQGKHMNTHRFPRFEVASIRKEEPLFSGTNDTHLHYDWL